MKKGRIGLKVREKGPYQKTGRITQLSPSGRYAVVKFPLPDGFATTRTIAVSQLEGAE